MMRLIITLLFPVVAQAEIEIDYKQICNEKWIFSSEQNTSITGDFEKHKKIARITFPLWLYVAISGVIVYLMISPYY